MPRGRPADKAPFPARNYKRAKKRFKNRKPKAPFTNNQVKALKEVVKQAKGTFTDTRESTTLSTVMGAVLPVSNSAFFKLATGDGDDSREGGSVSAQSLTIKGTLSSADLKDTVVRMMLIQYENFSGAHIREVLENYQPPVGDYSDANIVINSFRKMNPEVKYRVLKQKFITIPGGNNSINNMVVRRFNITHKFTKAQSGMNYDGDAAVGPDKNPVWLYACYAKQTSTHTAPKIEYQVRGKYIR